MKPGLRFMRKKRIWMPLVAILVVILAGSGALWSYHDNPQFCATCHIMDPYLESWESPPLLASAHEEQGLACLDCHAFDIGQSVGEVVSFVLHDYEEPLMEREYPQEWCFQCHEQGSYGEIIALTERLVEEVGRNPHNSHFGEMRCNLCHKMHKPSEDFCSQCHGTVATGEGWISLETEEEPVASGIE